MSFSKAAEEPRSLKCVRCRHHGIIVPQKGHMKHCPFLKCECWKCYLVTQRTRITSLQRSLKTGQKKPSNKKQQTGVSVERPAATHPPCSNSDGSAHASAALGMTSPPAAEAPGSDASAARSPLDLRSRPAVWGNNGAGVESRKELPSSSSLEGPCTPANAPYLGEFAPLSVCNYPIRMPGHFPSSYAPCRNLLLNMPWLPPVQAGFYNSGLYGPLMFPLSQLGPVYYPPASLPGLPADCRQVHVKHQLPSLPEPFQEDLMSVQNPQHPQPNTEDFVEIE